MKRLVEFPLEEGSTIFVEVDETWVESEVVRVGTQPEIEKAQNTFEVTVSKIKPIAESVIATLRNIPKPPDEIELKFGLKFNGKLGIYIASASTEANFNIKLIWKQEKK